MCLEPEYFEKRQKRQEEWESRGYIELGTLEDLLGIGEQDLISVGLLESSPSRTTIDLRETVVSEAGRKFIKSADCQLLLVKPAEILSLLRVLQEAGKLSGNGS